ATSQDMGVMIHGGTFCHNAGRSAQAESSEGIGGHRAANRRRLAGMPPLPASLGLFVIAALALLLTPGPAVLYIVTRSVDQGRRGPRWVRRQPAQPEDRAVLPGLPAAVRRRRARPRGRAGARARAAVHRAGTLHRRAVRLRRRHGRALAARTPALPGRRALGG